MIFTYGKAAYDFDKWKKAHSHAEWILNNYSMSDEMFHNIVIEWLDTVGIIISINYETFGDYFFNAMVTKGHLTTNLRTHSKTRLEAIKEAVNHSFNYYNENNDFNCDNQFCSGGKIDLSYGEIMRCQECGD